jgi:glyoxylase-like metal-dependent hydrolase (beta-lactamase superfamily II)
MSAPTAAPDYEIHAIRYAHDPKRRLAENFLPPLTEPVDLHESPMPMDFFVWAITGGGRTILLDTGFDQAGAVKRAREIVFPVAEGLKAVGVQPDTVQDVVLSHMHWDHAGNNDLFPQARFHVQDREMAFCTGRCMCHPFVRRPFEIEDVTAMVRRIHAGNAQFHDGVGEIAPGITVHLVGGHSKGLQILRVKTARGWVVLASDASHYYANMEQNRPFPLAVDVTEMLDGYALARQLASSPQHIIPGHDPAVLARYPQSRSGLAHAVRVDLAPIRD